MHLVSADLLNSLGPLMLSVSDTSDILTKVFAWLFSIALCTRMMENLRLSQKPRLGLLSLNLAVPPNQLQVQMVLSPRRLQRYVCSSRSHLKLQMHAASLSRFCEPVDRQRLFRVWCLRRQHLSLVMHQLIRNRWQLMMLLLPLCCRTPTNDQCLHYTQASEYLLLYGFLLLFNLVIISCMVSILSAGVFHVSSVCILYVLLYWMDFKVKLV